MLVDVAVGGGSVAVGGSAVAVGVGSRRVGVGDRGVFVGLVIAREREAPEAGVPLVIWIAPMSKAGPRGLAK
jgi:hypothetical protein